MSHLALNIPSTDPAPRDHRDVGRGQIFDSAALSAPSSAGQLPAWNTPQGTASQYRLPPNEVLKGLANRFVHSTAYIYLYATMALASFLTVILSLMSQCPGTIFYLIEMAVNVVLVLEVSVRFVAFGRQFWHSTFNILDLFLVLLCTLTLMVIFFSHDCSPYNRGSGNDGKGRGGRQGKGEELLDSLLLIFRNGMQLIRLLAVVRRSGRNALSRPARIELDLPSDASSQGNAHPSSLGRARRKSANNTTAGARGQHDFSLDIDLEDDAEATRSRMRDGGDRTAVSGGARGTGRAGEAERQRLMNDYDDTYREDDDEEL
ncbi:unnamed protein product [Parajaminaea phylloscopi]